LQIARSFAGFSYAQADILRKAVGKKIKNLLDEQKEKFIQGAIKNGSDQKTAEGVWDFIEPFARYGFNRAHAACYAMISYQTAYLKAHYPSAFMASWLSAEQQDIDKVAFAVSEAKAMKIEVLPPQINESFVEFGVVKTSGNIRFGLAAIKNVGEGVSESIVGERKNRGPYLTLADFLRRLGPKILNKKVIEALAKSGSLDDFAERNQILVNLDKILKFISDLGKMESSSQMDLFANATAKPKLAELDLQAATPADKKQKLAWEKELLGMYISEHPLKGMEKIIAKEGVPISSLNLAMNEKQVQIAGLVVNSKKILTKKGEPMMFVNIEDGSGKIEVIVFPRVLQANPSVWISDNILKIKGRLNNKDGVLKIIAMEATPVQEEENAAEIAEPEKLLIWLPAKVNKEDLAQIKEILAKFPGTLPMILHLPKNGGYKEVKTKVRVVFDKNLAKELTQVLPEAKISFV
jgi:DNA polymerase-3 subunit alpha